MFAATVAMACAAEVTFDLTSGYTNAEDVTQIIKDGVTLDLSNGTNKSNGPKWYNTGKALRLYASNTMTVTATGNIESVTFTFADKSYTMNASETALANVSVGTYTEETTAGKWVIGTAKTATITRGGTSGHARIQKIVVVTKAADGSLAAPSFSVAAGTYYEKQTVAITNPNTTGKVYYTTDDSEPTAASTEYTAPVVIEESATLKAIVIDGEKKSAVTSAEYTIADLPEVAGIADFLKLNKGEKAKFKNPIVVAATYKSKGGSVSYYCSDETGGIQLFDATGKIQEYKAKDVIPAGFVAEYDLYNAIPEAINITGLTPATETKDAPFVVTTIEELSTDMVGAVVQVKGAEIKTTDAGFTISDATGTIDGYNKFSIDIAAGKNLLINAVLNVYSGKMQLYPYAISNEGGTDQAGILTESKVEVVPGNGEITVSGSGDVDVYDTEGRRATTVKGSGDYPPKKKTHVIETDPGVYIVVCEGEAGKVLVD